MQTEFRQNVGVGLEVTKKNIIVAIPCFNTESFIGSIVSRVKKHFTMVVVVDDGSCDRTAEVAKDAGAMVIRHRVNRGYGEAIKSCFEAANVNGADVLVILDGDGQHNPDEIPKLLDPIIKGEAELIIGSRFLSEQHKMPRYRRFGIRVINYSFNLGSKSKVSDSQCGFRAYNKRMFQTLSVSEKGMSISIEILEKARRTGAIIKEVPITCLYEPSVLNSKAVRHGLSVVFSTFRIRLKNALLA